MAYCSSVQSKSVGPRSGWLSAQTKKNGSGSKLVPAEVDKLVPAEVDESTSQNGTAAAVTDIPGISVVHREIGI